MDIELLRKEQCLRAPVRLWAGLAASPSASWAVSEHPITRAQAIRFVGHRAISDAQSIGGGLHA